MYPYGYIDETTFKTSPFPRNNFPNLVAFGIEMPAGIEVGMVFQSCNRDELELDVYAGGVFVGTQKHAPGEMYDGHHTKIVYRNPQTNEPHAFRTGANNTPTENRRVIGGQDAEVSGTILISIHRPKAGTECLLRPNGIGEFKVLVDENEKIGVILKKLGDYSDRYVRDGQGQPVDPDLKFRDRFRKELMNGVQPVMRACITAGCSGFNAVGRQVRLEEGSSLASRYRFDAVPKFDRDTRHDSINSVGICILENQAYQLIG